MGHLTRWPVFQDGINIVVLALFALGAIVRWGVLVVRIQAGVARLFLRCELDPRFLLRRGHVAP